MKQHKKILLPLAALLALAIVISVTLGDGAAPSAKAESGLAAGVSAAWTTGSPAEHARSTPAVLPPTVLMSADFAVMYSNVGQLREAADVIVRGDVIDVSYLDFRSTAYTKVTFLVVKSLKGDIAPGSKITIVEVGGVTSMSTINGDKFGAPTSADADTKVSVQLDGAPLSQVGDKCLYFLGIGSIGVVPGTYYVPLGAYQGRFKIDQGVAKRFVPAGWEAGAYTALPMAESTVDQTVLQAEAE
jgi:hypothetical protein